MKSTQPSLSRSRTGIFNLMRHRRYGDADWNSFIFPLITATLVFFTLVVFPACSSDNSFSADISISESESTGIVLTFIADSRVSGMNVLDEKGRTMLSQPLPDLREGELVLPIASVEREITVVLISDRGDSFEKKFGLRKTDQPIAGIRLLFQTEDQADLPILLIPSSTAPLILSFNFENLPADHYNLDLRCDGPLQLSTDGEQWSNRLSFGETSDSTAMEIDRNLYLRIPSDAGPAEYIVKGEISPSKSGGQSIVGFEKKVVVVRESELTKQISIDSVVMPTSRDGKEKGGLQSNYLALSGEVLNSGSDISDAASSGQRYPLSYQTVVAQNRFEFPVGVVLTAQVLDSDGQPAESFRVPLSLPGPRVQMGAILPARGIARVTLPIYGDADSIEPGEYSRNIELVLAGTNIVLDRVETGLTVERPAELAMMVTLFAAGIAIIAIGLILLRGSRLHSGFTTRQIVLTGLFAAATVVLVNVPAYFLTSITVVLLGPLGFLVDGLLSEFIFFALLVALVSIVPRQGVCATVVGVRFLLGGILLGMITPVGILYATISAITLEIALWFTLHGGMEVRLNERLPLRSILLFALANAFISWAGFQFSIVLFRLHYAYWYIALSVIIGGFLYAMLGSLAGRRIGARLARAVP